MALKTANGFAHTEVRAAHTGVQSATAVYNGNGETLSAGDVIQMIKLPDGATIIDLQLRGASGNTNGTVFNCGDDGNTSRYLVNTTLSASLALVRGALSLPNKISLSDDVRPRWDTVDLTVVSTASVTTTCSIQLTVLYAMEGAI